MVTGYWNQREPTRWQAVPPQVLIDANADRFTGGGIGVHQFENDLRAAGYDFRTFMGSNFDTLRTVVKRKPVIAHVRWNWEPGGQPHGVIVYKVDANYVYVADPGTATEYAVPVEKFRQSWEGDFNGQTRTFHVIAPPPPAWKVTKKLGRQAPQQEAPARQTTAQASPPKWQRGRGLAGASGRDRRQET